MKYALVLGLLAGCGLSPSGVGTDPAEPDPGHPVGTPPPLRPVASGTYRLVSRVDVPVEAVLPEQAEAAVATLRALSINPARALITAADDAGVPAVGELYDVLPGPLADRLEGWINDEIAGVRIDGVPVTVYAGQIAALADRALTRFAFTSELTIQAATAHHRLTGLDLTPAGAAIIVPIRGLAGELLGQDTQAGSAGGALVLGEQHFGVAYGEYAWQGIEAMSRARDGSGIRDVLGAAIDCPGVARRVAARCVLGVCVGHDAELTAICDAGLEAIVELAHDRIAGYRLEVLHLAGGAATLADDDRDGIADRLTAGTWQAELDLGAGLRHAPATFTGVR
jgi:hypothetical protein